MTIVSARQGRRLLAALVLAAPFLIRPFLANTDRPPAVVSAPARGFPINNGYPALARGADGGLWLAWVAREVADPNRRGGDKDLVLYDHIVVKHRDTQGWSRTVRVSTDLTLNSDPAVVATSDGAWIFWTRNIHGEYRLMRRHIAPDLSLDAAAAFQRRGVPDAAPAALRTPDGVIWLAWESVASGHSTIFTMVNRNGAWSSPEPVSDSHYHAFRPALDVSGDGVVSLVWDGGGGPFYQVFLRQWQRGQWGEMQTIPSRALDSYAPKVAAAGGAEVWIAYAENPRQRADWGLRGRETTPAPRPSVRAVRWSGGRWLSAPGPDSNDSGLVVANADVPRIIRSPRGAVAIVFMRLISHLNFRLAVCRLESKGWSGAEELGNNEELYQHMLLPGTPKARIDQRPSLVASGDAFEMAYEKGTGWGKDRQISVRELDAGAPPGDSVPYVSTQAAPVPARPESHTVATLGGYNIYFGDIHNHLLMDDGWTGTADQFYRFAGDRRELDFGAYTPHAESNKLLGSEVALVERIAGLYNEPGRFAAIPGWEWTQGDFIVPREGHKHVLKEVDDQPFFSSLEGTSDTARELTRLMKSTRSIMFAHHVGRGATGGANFDALDPAVEPDVEITSQWGRFEYFKNPGSTKDEVSGSTVQDAWRKGLHIGVVGGSDNHDLFLERGTALTAVLAKTLDRHSVFEALRARRCYATTGEKILLDVRVNGAVMGSEISAATSPVVKVQAIGTNVLEKVEIVKFWKGAPDPFPAVYSVTPNVNETRFEWKDLTFREDCAYYVRVTQRADPAISGKKNFGNATGFPSEMAWSSPVWVRRK